MKEKGHVFILLRVLGPVLGVCRILNRYRRILSRSRLTTWYQRPGSNHALGDCVDNSHVLRLLGLGFR